jgi:actin-related protein
MVESGKKIIVLDNGANIKVGFAGEKEPREVFPSIVGRPKYKSVTQALNQKNEYFGCDAMAKRGVLNLEYTFADGVVKSWDDMEKVWDYGFKELRYDPAEAFGILLMQSCLNTSEKDTEKMVETMFETFGADKV